MRIVDADALIKNLEDIDLYKEDKVGKYGVLKAILIVEKMAYEISDDGEEEE